MLSLAPVILVIPKLFPTIAAAARWRVLIHVALKTAM